MSLCAGRVDFFCPGGKGCAVCCQDFGFGVRHKAYVNGLWRWRSLTKPEENTTVCAKTFQIRMASWSILTVEIQARRNLDSWQHGLVKCNGAR